MHWVHPEASLQCDLHGFRVGIANISDYSQNSARRNISTKIFPTASHKS